MTQEAFDLVVVGGGSSGCVVAAGALQSGRRVLVLEGGPDTEAHGATLRADGYKDAFTDDALFWHRFSTRDRRWAGRALFAGTGRGLGGSGSINAMVYTRGAREDFEEWPQGWRWDDVQPYFEAVEAVLRPSPRAPTRWTEAAIAAAEQAGFARSEDLNQGAMSGVLGYEHMNAEGGARRSSYVGFLRPLRGAEEKLEVRTGCQVERLEFEGRRARAVHYLDAQGTRHRVLAEEVILCAGALATPTILERSGIGAAWMLRQRGIEVVADLPEVGENLHDHPNVQLFFRGKQPIDSAFPQLYGFHRANPHSDLPPSQSDTCYVFYPARSSLREGMMRLLPAMILPPGLYRQEGLRAGAKSIVARAFDHGVPEQFVESLWGIVVILGKPKSRGSVHIQRAHLARDAKINTAKIDPGYLRQREDLETLLRGVERARAIAHAPALAPYQGGELFPGPLGRHDRALAQWIRKNLMTTYHFAGSCRMGDDARAPVDPATLKLRGVEGVRVADASVMPSTPVSALNAPSMMIGARAAALLR